MSIYNEKGLTRFINCIAAATAVVLVTFAVLALKATFGW